MAHFYSRSPWKLTKSDTKSAYFTDRIFPPIYDREIDRISNCRVIKRTKNVTHSFRSSEKFSIKNLPYPLFGWPLETGLCMHHFSIVNPWASSPPLNCSNRTYHCRDSIPCNKLLGTQPSTFTTTTRGNPGLSAPWD